MNPHNKSYKDIPRLKLTESIRFMEGILTGLQIIKDMIMSTFVKLQLVRDEMLLVISLLLLFFLDLAILYGEA